ncbi:TetR/AcrR family transcriptional regulator [Streptomyces sp. 549]|uniref:TetR/AcrR family transcriptional regulator n=1 Tax=Streptomyces sp. 549 TaxID=3049076 RepID=UPI0024C3C68B|nr:TetR/AcrR family transcriptional regulator [Streptomyces sp. 549]MDK1473153.1 TetR/AcrR family transcriptional regulator [Streptomyces sp. 549]
MAEAGTGTPRQRYRAQVRAEIKERAWEQVATAGASALSLNAIAKQMGMSGPALYRYFASRDELITELIRDAYRSLADTFRAAAGPGTPDASRDEDASRGGDGAGAGVVALARAMRGWALDDPQRYLLIYGTPIPGYHAPDDVTELSRQIMATLLDACVALPPDHGAASPFAAHLEDHRQWAAHHAADPAALHRALAFWTRLHGALSLELAGHFTGMGFDPALLFAAEVESLTGALRPPGR